MVEKHPSPARRSEAPIQDHEDLDQRIVRIVSDEGDATLRTILERVRERLPVSRETVARRLARLIRFSQIVRLRHGHYAAGSSSTPPSSVLRMLNVSMTEVISPDGSARVHIEKEFIVLAGKCSQIMTQIEPAAGVRTCGAEATGPHHVRMTRYDRGGRTVVVARVVPAITAGSWTPHRFLLSLPLGPGTYVMHREPTSSVPPASPRFPRNRHGLGVLSNPEPGAIVETSKETVLNLRVYFPRGFPRGPVSARVTTIAVGRSLGASASSMVQLSRQSGGAFGLTVYDDMVSMRIKNPLIDCFYGFTWVPPKIGAFTDWIGGLLSNGRGPPVRVTPTPE